jgi:hypothetical protein
MCPTPPATALPHSVERKEQMPTEGIRLNFCIVANARGQRLSAVEVPGE